MRSAMSGPNPYPAALMSPQERRRELCANLALGLVRLRMRDNTQLSDDTGESSLHFPPDESGNRHAKHRRLP